MFFVFIKAFGWRGGRYDGGSGDMLYEASYKMHYNEGKFSLIRRSIKIVIKIVIFTEKPPKVSNFNASFFQ